MTSGISISRCCTSIWWMKSPEVYTSYWISLSKWITHQKLRSFKKYRNVMTIEWTFLLFQICTNLDAFTNGLLWNGLILFISMLNRSYQLIRNIIHFLCIIPWYKASYAVIPCYKASYAAGISYSAPLNIFFSYCSTASPIFVWLFFVVGWDIYLL